MPNITVNEIDNSRYVTATANSPMTVLIISTASFGPTFNATLPQVFTFNGASDLNNFYYTFGVTPAVKGTSILSNDNTFEYVTNLLRSGATVKFCRINGGNVANDGNSPTLVTAKYSGTFGNRLVAEFSAIKTGATTYSTTDALLNVYVADKAYAVGATRTATVSFTTRVSTNPSSDVYIDNLDLKWVNVSATSLATIITTIASNTSHSVQYDLRDGTDYSATDSNENIAIKIAEAFGNFSDSYLFNFDFVSSGGFIAGSGNYDKPTSVSGEAVSIATSATTLTLVNHPVVPGTLTIGNNSDTPSNDGTTGAINLPIGTSGGNVSATITYSTGVLTFDAAVTALTSTANYTYTTSTAYADELNTKMCELCQTRGDAIALIDCAKDTNYVNTVDYAQNFNTSYAAIYAPWCKIVSSTTGVNIWAPPSLIFLKALLNGMSKEESPELWYVPAGVTRMSAPFVIETEYEIGSVILTAFQNTTDFAHLAKVNPIMNVRNYGYCIYGNSTLQKLVIGQGRSALESMNVRLIANVIKKHIFDVCSGLSFEYNNSQLWLKFYTQMDEKLLYMKRHYGLYDYKIVMDNTTVTVDAVQERRVPGKVLISPTLAGEYFDIDFEIVPAGVTFTEEG